MLLARLALLKPNRSRYHVFIFAVEKSIAFYRRFGFREFQGWQDAHGDTHPSGHLLITSYEIRRCRVMLQDHGIVLPEDEDQIPLRTDVVQSCAASNPATRSSYQCGHSWAGLLSR